MGEGRGGEVREWTVRCSDAQKRKWRVRSQHVVCLETIKTFCFLGYGAGDEGGEEYGNCQQFHCGGKEGNFVGVVTKSSRLIVARSWGLGGASKTPHDVLFCCVENDMLKMMKKLEKKSSPLFFLSHIFACFNVFPRRITLYFSVTSTMEKPQDYGRSFDGEGETVGLTSNRNQYLETEHNPYLDAPPSYSKDEDKGWSTLCKCCTCYYVCTVLIILAIVIYFAVMGDKNLEPDSTIPLRA